MVSRGVKGADHSFGGKNKKNWEMKRRFVFRDLQEFWNQIARIVNSVTKLGDF